MVDLEALEAAAGVPEIAEVGEAAEESQETDDVVEVPVEEEAEPENEADDAPVELEEEAVPAPTSSPGKSTGGFEFKISIDGLLNYQQFQFRLRTRTRTGKRKACKGKEILNPYQVTNWWGNDWDGRLSETFTSRPMQSFH